MSVTVNCCENCNFRKILCNCTTWCHSKGEADNQETVLYTDSAKQIVILSTPMADCKSQALLSLDDLQTTDTVMFGSNGEDVLILMIQGHYMLRQLAEGLDNKSVLGKTVEEAFPPHMSNFLKPIYEKTLDGFFYHLTVQWMNSTFLFRTFPLLNLEKKIIGGLSIVSPFQTKFNGNINRLALNEPKLKRRHTRRGRRKTQRIDLTKPRQQSMSMYEQESGRSSPVEEKSKLDSRADQPGGSTDLIGVVQQLNNSGMLDRFLVDSMVHAAQKL